MVARKRQRTSRSNRSPWRLVPALVLALVILAVALSPSSPIGLTEPSGGGSRVAAVATDSLNLRAAPTLDAAIVTVLAAGDEVEITGEAQHGFAPVRVDTYRGWLAVEYLSFGERMESGEPAVVAAAEPVADEPVEAAEPPPRDEAPVAEPTAAPAEPAQRWIRIDRSDATVTLYEGDLAIAVFPGRIGRDQSADGFYSTAVGIYHVYSMNRGLAPTPFAEDTYLTHWVGFDPVRHNGIHSPVRNADGSVREWQNATTLGCVRLAAGDAVTVFEFAHVGMRVEVRE